MRVIDKERQGFCSASATTTERQCVRDPERLIRPIRLLGGAPLQDRGRRCGESVHNSSRSSTLSPGSSNSRATAHAAERSNSPPRACNTLSPMSSARSATTRNNVVFPIPAGPSSKPVPPSPRCTPSSQRSIALSSSSRCTSTRQASPHRERGQPQALIVLVAADTVATPVAPERRRCDPNRGGTTMRGGFRPKTMTDCGSPDRRKGNQRSHDRAGRASVLAPR